MANKKTSTTYNNDSVNVLEGLEGIRQRYHMYVGSEPIIHCIKEVLDNSIDEVMNGYADTVTVTLDTKKNRYCITDNGRGLPNGYNSKVKKNNIEILHTMLHSGAKFDNNTEFKSSGGQNGVGLKALCALTKYLKVTSERDDDTRRYMEFSKGKATSKAIDEKLTGKTGTKTEFIPDDELLPEDKVAPDCEALKTTCKMRSYLNKGVTIDLTIDKEKYSYVAENGIEDYIKDTTVNPLYGIEPILISKAIDGNYYEMCFTFENTVDEIIDGYCNSIVLNRGTHETGLKRGLTNVFTKYIQENDLLGKRDKNLEIKGEDIRKGLRCIMNMKVVAPEYGGQQ